MERRKFLFSIAITGLGGVFSARSLHAQEASIDSVFNGEEILDVGVLLDEQIEVSSESVKVVYEKVVYSNPPTKDQIEHIKQIARDKLKIYRTNRRGRYAVPTDETFLRVMDCESDFNPYAKGFGGAMGLMQFIPTTWMYVKNNLLVRPDADVFNPEDNIEGAILYWMMDGPSRWDCK